MFVRPCSKHTAIGFPSNINLAFGSALRTSTNGRLYRQRTARTITSRPLDAAFLGSVYTVNASKTTLDDLIQEVRPLDLQTGSSHRGIASLLLLLSPRYARHALDERTPRAVFERLRGEGTGASSLESTVAVVDKLPTPDGGNGSEGIAFAFQNGPSTSLMQLAKPLQQSAQKPGSLSFELAARPAGTRPQLWRLQLPLTTTIFSTGLVSTLIQRIHDFSNASQQTSLISESFLESQNFRLSSLDSESVVQTRANLIPLTLPRAITNSMGNIVRTLSDKHTLRHASNSTTPQPESPGSNIPASQELEGAVTSYFRTLNAAPEPVSVWGLIIPKHFSRDVLETASLGQIVDHTSESLRETWLQHFDRASTVSDIGLSLAVLLSNGCRLIKILSGGGGWGKKVGLLSLDPDSEYSTRELREDQGWDFDLDGANDVTQSATEKQLNAALGHVVDKGDHIMFFLGRNSAIAPTNSTIDVPMTQMTATFGTRLAHVDPGMAEMATQPSEAAQTDASYCPNFFGALSETGMALTVSQGDTIVCKTKLDAPCLDVIVSDSSS